MVQRLCHLQLESCSCIGKFGAIIDPFSADYWVYKSVLIFVHLFSFLYSSCICRTIFHHYLLQMLFKKYFSFFRGKHLVFHLKTQNKKFWSLLLGRIGIHFNQVAKYVKKVADLEGVYILKFDHKSWGLNSLFYTLCVCFRLTLPCIFV